MLYLRQSGALLMLMLMAGAAPRADTISQTNAQGKTVVVHRNAILVAEDSSSLTYKHFELKERRVVKVRLSKGSLPYSVVTSSPEDRRGIVNTWKRFGYTAALTDQSGKTTQVYALYLDFYPPAGRGSLLESIPPRTTFPILVEGGGADEVEFSGIARIEFKGNQVKLTLRNGELREARFLSPTDQPAEARFLGITDRYDPSSSEVFDFSVPLGRLREIRFEP